ncbi:MULTISPECIES: DNA mismatch repair endonuclease MutL [unclassified Idiomarina]|uniref:DNA mismatch repair endonuclease MutL n=1 Tax=unclassified Idiomarina TaxID=2614829 RepID=UPI000C5983A4|nr:MULTISPECIES: DNA mismatch repair endonuclease MutL [unclassified Idiomarina]MAA62836.1 DNA mismatch repair protein MutL [Idiomarina sp.]|tara:strand:+ start:142356 stop:144089 length:1734 start_codon:yes stop_codon:yes gene_type:complete
MAIQQLPIELANQIAAGEVVERPSSVVKELVENALDAGATQLILDIEQGGSKRIRIRDNGGGIVKQELTLALSRHATSKIQSLDDLEHIGSLGFRGEALASISSVSRLRLISKPPEQEEAWQAWAEGRDMQVTVEPAAHPDGTTVDIQDLFFNTPARRKFLRTEKTEFSHIDEVIKRIALSRFEVGFQLNHNGKSVRAFPSAQTEKQQLQRLAKICGGGFAEQAAAIDAVDGDFHLSGWLVPPEHCRHQGDIQHFFVNGRMMRDKLLSHAVRQAYEKYLPNERVPTFVLYFELPAEEVDVNVHPAKHEVRFHRQRQVHDFILTRIEQALNQLVATENGQPAMSHQHSYSSHERSSGTQSNSCRGASGASFLGERKASGSLLPNAARAHQSNAGTQLNTESEAEFKAAQNWRVLSVFNGVYALIRNEYSLAWLNLAKVHIECVSRKLTQQLQDGLNGQPLLVPVAISLANLPGPASQWPQQQLNQCGVVYKIQREQAIIEQMPEMLRQGNVVSGFSQLLTLLTEGAEADQLAHWLAQFSGLESYSLTQAEHWLIQWRSQLAESADVLQKLPLPGENNA